MSALEPIIAVDTSEIREGRLDDLGAALEELVAFVEANEPEPISYGVRAARARV